MIPAAVMKAVYELGAPAFSAAMKKAASAPQLPTCSGVWSGQARVTAAMKAAANTSRPTSGVGGERNSHQSSTVFHQVPETGLLPAAAIHATSSASPASSTSQRYAMR